MNFRVAANHGLSILPPWAALWILILATCIGRTAIAEGELSGSELLALCGGLNGQTHQREECNRFFQDTLTRFDADEHDPRMLRYCIPAGISTPELVELYRRESQIYPYVLHVPAARLVLGMVLKFFPCQSV